MAGKKQQNIYLSGPSSGKTDTHSYEVGGITFVVEPSYNENGESVEDIVKKLIIRDVENSR